MKKLNELKEPPLYWNERYRRGGFSGNGSVGDLGRWKVQVVGDFILKNEIESIVDMGCGDGVWLAQLRTFLNKQWDGVEYTGVDISAEAIQACNKIFLTSQNTLFLTTEIYRVANHEPAELALSIDVIFHQSNDDLYEEYMNVLVNASTDWLIIFSNDRQRPKPKSYKVGDHIHFRKFTSWIEEYAPQWELHEKIDSPFKIKEGRRNFSWADFYIYKRNDRD